MNYTQQDILDKIARRIDYQEVARLLELDLNTIAQQVVTNPEDYLEFKVFFDFGEFDTTINGQAPGEGQGFHITPVLLSLVSGNYTTEKGPQIYQTQFRVEAFAFQKDMENLRAVFEVYSSLNQGAVSTGLFANALTTSITDFPVFSEVTQYKGFERVSVFMSWLMTFIYSGQLANEVAYTINSNAANLLDLTIKRLRVGDSIQRNNEEETSTLNKSQVLTFTGFMVYDGTEAAKTLLRNIKNLGQGLADEFTFTVTYPAITEDDIAETDTYTVVITEGDIKITQGGYINLTFGMTLA